MAHILHLKGRISYLFFDVRNEALLPTEFFELVFVLNIDNLRVNVFDISFKALKFAIFKSSAFLKFFFILLYCLLLDLELHDGADSLTYLLGHFHSSVVTSRGPLGIQIDKISVEVVPKLFNTYFIDFLQVRGLLIDPFDFALELVFYLSLRRALL